MELVALLHRGDYGVRLRVSLDRRHGLVAVRVEALAGDRRDRGDAGLLEGLRELAQRELYAVAQGFRTRILVGEGRLQAVDHGKQRLGEALDGVLLRVGGFRLV